MKAAWKFILLGSKQEEETAAAETEQSVTIAAVSEDYCDKNQ